MTATSRAAWSAAFAALAIGCGAPAAPAKIVGGATIASASPKAPRPPAKEFDPCEGSAPLDKAYAGILATARCDQEKFLMMASVAGQLGVECTYCHVRDASDPKKLDYPVMTSKKEIATWMHAHLMHAVRPADGSPMRCKSCHTDEQGKPVAKILGEPRDLGRAQEWMTLVMVNKFVTASGDKLKCKSCHGDNFSKPGFAKDVLLRTERLPAHE